MRAPSGLAAAVAAASAAEAEAEAAAAAAPPDGALAAPQVAPPAAPEGPGAAAACGPAEEGNGTAAGSREEVAAGARTQSAHSVLVLSPHSGPRQPRRSSYGGGGGGGGGGGEPGARRVRFANVGALEAWEVREDLEDLPVPYRSPEEEAGSQSSGSSLLSPLLSPRVSPRPSPRPNARPMHKHNPWLAGRGCLAVLVILGIFCLTGVRLAQIGFFDGPSHEDSPIIEDGVALDRETGVRFMMRTLPPGWRSETSFNLFSLHTRLDTNKSRTCIVGLYVENRTDDFARWKRYIESRDLEGLRQELFSSGHRMALRVVMLRDGPAGLVSWPWSIELGEYLSALHPFRPRLAEMATEAFRVWFPSQLSKGDVMWFNWDWDQDVTLAYWNREPRGPPRFGDLGEALFGNEFEHRRNPFALLFTHYFF